ncbi:MAG: hypothetical protein CM15mP128_4420 [Methanobacteriota archaeon]|nr:MAG: hypothetical protein CM15mP128_4420 [Euryarchaeota archaeon]
MRKMATTLPMCVVDYMDTTKLLKRGDIAAAIRAVRLAPGDKVLILGHHYQRDGHCRARHYTGTRSCSAGKARIPSDDHRVRGVHFMAESADVLRGTSKRC